jgi:hypothetical protein
MHRFSKSVFDEFIDNGAVVSYSSILHASDLANGRQIGVIAVCSQISVPGTTTLTVTLEHSGDGQRFTPKTTLMNAVVLGTLGSQPSGSLAIRTAGESAPVAPTLRFVRFAITLSQATGVPSAYVKLAASVRGSPDRPDEPAVQPVPGKAAAGTLTRHEQMAGEIESLASASAHLAPAQRAKHLVQNLSEDSKEHLREIDRRIRTMAPEVKAHFFASTARMLGDALTASRLQAQASQQPCCVSAATAGGCGDEPCVPGSKS